MGEKAREKSHDETAREVDDERAEREVRGEQPSHAVGEKVAGDAAQRGAEGHDDEVVHVVFSFVRLRMYEEAGESCWRSGILFLSLTVF